MSMLRFIILLLVWSILSVAQTQASSVSESVDSVIADKYVGWTAQKFQQYEDSLKRTLYPIVEEVETVHASLEETESTLTGKSVSVPEIINYHVPNSMPVDTAKSVGQISIMTGTTPTGAKSYSIPIDVYPGVSGFQPNLTLEYSSRQGNSILGMGWSVSGISVIARGGKSRYYDDRTEGIRMDLDDSFVMDGVRFIKTDAADTEIIYETETGNIKAKGYVFANVIKYFEVFYPNGNVAIFGYDSNTSNKLFYPITRLTDLNGNTIVYSYLCEGEMYRISQISYNGTSVMFGYSSRQDSLTMFRAGMMLNENHLLTSIRVVLFNGVVNGEYALKYTTRNSTSLLTNISYVSDGKSYNPLTFFYGEGISQTDSDYKVSCSHLNKWHNFDKPGALRVIRGKFGSNTDADGVITFPNYNPYWQHYSPGWLFGHTQNRFDNLFSGNENIFIYSGIGKSHVKSFSEIKTENGFVDVLCLDLDGTNEDCIVKINNFVVNDKERIVFKVYKVDETGGITERFTKLFDFDTVYTDNDGKKSVQPKHYFSGDFNGDGKMEILAVSAHQPFGDITKPSKCYIFDLNKEWVYCKKHIFDYNVDFVGVNQTDPQSAFDNTDKLLVLDCDGDGKTELCHISDEGTNIYSFDKFFYETKFSTSYDLKKSKTKYRKIFSCDYNGDGQDDILLSPINRGRADSVWTIYNSKGNGQFSKYTFAGPINHKNDSSGFVIQDINGDGQPDILSFSNAGFSTYLTKNNHLGSLIRWTKYLEEGAILIPADIYHNGRITSLIGLKNGSLTKYSFVRNDNKESLITGMANSFGVVEKNLYYFLNEDGTATDFYTKGSGAEFPFVNIQEPLAVVVATETYLNGDRVDNSVYKYKNAVLHKQGLGFCGFENVVSYDSRGDYVERIFNPFNHGLLESEKTKRFSTDYTYEVKRRNNQTRQFLLTKKVEKDRRTNFSTTTTYTYDSLAYPTREYVVYTGSIYKTTDFKYTHNNTLKAGHYLGFMIDKVTTKRRGGNTNTVRTYIPVHSKCQPIVTVEFCEGLQVLQKSYTYDKKGNPTSETIKEYSSPYSNTSRITYDGSGRIIGKTDFLGNQTKYDYDNHGRVVSITDARGGITKKTYDAFGREIKTVYPDGVEEFTQFAWTDEAGGQYGITSGKSGQPLVSIIYDALGREVRSKELTFNGTYRKVDRLYDEYGKLKKVSLPFTGNNASRWNTYTINEYDQPISITEASGRRTTWSYNGNTIVKTTDKVFRASTYDAIGHVTSVTDPAGIIEYTLRADGQVSKITAPGDVTTKFGYDSYGRILSVEDPSFGTTVYKYDDAGNMVSSTDANEQTITYEYDSYGRIVKRILPEFSTEYAYDSYGLPSGNCSDNGTSTVFTYDEYGRLSTEVEYGFDNVWLQKDYAYDDGNISSIQYTSHKGVLTTEKYNYSNGTLSEVVLDDGTPIYTLKSENNFGQPLQVQTGNIIRRWKYTDFGLPSGQNAGSSSALYQNIGYVIEAPTGNVLTRSDNKRNLTEQFRYDNLNRLSTYGKEKVEYDLKGNITSKTDAGVFSYSNDTKPYAVTSLETDNETVPSSTQIVGYTSFFRPSLISQDSCYVMLSYNSRFDRVKSVFYRGLNPIKKHYLAGCYELEKNGSIIEERLYLCGDYYSAPAVYIKPGFEVEWDVSRPNKQASSQGKVYNIIRDYLGSITHIYDGDTLLQELSYDAWGRLREPDTQQVYNPGEEPRLLLGRGYCGHEYLSDFGLVNMNARLYDPVLGRFLSPDPNIQCPDWSQNYNRYTYVMNNPLRYIDENGEFFWLAVGVAAVVTGAINVATHWKEIKSSGGGWKNVLKGVGYFLNGAVAGGVGTAIGIGTAVGFGSMLTASAAGVANATVGFYQGAIYGATYGATSGFITGTANSLIEGYKFGYAILNGIMQGTAEAISGGLTSGLLSGARASLSGREFLTGRYTNEAIVIRAGVGAENSLGGKGAIAGTKKHKYTREFIDKVNEIYENTGLKVHESKKYLGKVNYFDVLDLKNGIIYDYKFGYPNVPVLRLNNTPQMLRYRLSIQAPSIVIKIQQKSIEISPIVWP